MPHKYDTKFNLLRVTVLSAVVSAGTANAVSSISPQETLGMSSASIETINQAKLQSFDAISQMRMASQKTLSGMSSYYDEGLGKTTFLWANDSMTKPLMANIEEEHRSGFAASHYMSMLTSVSMDKASSNSAKMAYMHDLGKGALIAKFKQEAWGVEVFNREMNIAMDREHNFVAASGYFSRSRVNESDFHKLDDFGSAEVAIKHAIQNLVGEEIIVELSNKTDKGHYEWFDGLTDGNYVFDTLRAKKVFFDSNEDMRAAYYVEVGLADESTTDGKYYGYVIDAKNGKVLFKNNMVQEESPFTYRAYLNNNGYPLESPHGDVMPTAVRGQDPTVILPAPLITLSRFIEFSRQDPWLPPNATSTDGNNVFAYADLAEPDGFGSGDIRVPLTSDRVFDYQLSGNQDAQSTNNINAAIVNLFVMNNFLHDYYYDFGFDEASGNGQDNNFGRGGLGNDAILAEAQDFDGLNNANMRTPADGASGRMQQFLFNSKDAREGVDFGVNITAPNLGLRTSQGAAFGPNEYNVTGSVVRMLDGSTGPDGTGTEFDGCETPTNPNEILGNIAIVDRGECNFTVKVVNAQNAGAVAVIIVNNRPDNGAPPRLGGEDDEITIPARSVTFADGPTFYNVIDSGGNLTAQVFDNFLLKDSTFDNGIIAHEFGHFIQNRLIGNGSGLGTLQARALGEGWSDFHALLFTALEDDAQIPGNDQFQINYGVGTFVVDFFRGIRRGPYSTDMNVNPLTFTHIQDGATPPGFPPTNANDESPHPPGELWAVSLWDIYVGLINTHGFQEAQDRMSGYVIAGLKMTPINPLYTEARDALLAVISANDSNDFNLALNAFARRGLGLGAVSPPRESEDLVGAIESFSTTRVSFNANEFVLNPDFNGETLGFCSNDNILDEGETGAISFDIFNSSSQALSGLTAQIILVDELGQPLSDQSIVSIENNGVVNLGNLPAFTTTEFGPILVTLNDVAIGQRLNFQLSFDSSNNIDVPSALNLSTLVNFDFVGRALVGNSATDDMESLSVLNDWAENVEFGGDAARNSRRLDRLEVDFFQTRNPSIDLGEQSQVINNNGFFSDISYETREFTVLDTGEFTMSFWHFYDFEEGFDGGVIEVSLDGGEWQDVTDVGGVFDVGYSSIDTSRSVVLRGRSAFTGTNAANGSPVNDTGNVETLRFGNALSSQNVRFRLRVLTDQNTGAEGWRIDNVLFENVASPIFSNVIAGNDSRVECDSLPLIRIDNTDIELSDDEQGAYSATVFNRNNPTASITYLWRQVSGPNVLSTSGETTPNFSFVPATVETETNLSFELSVSDGVANATTLVNATIASAAASNPPPPPPPTPEPATPAPSNDSGGGTMSWMLGMMLIVLMRRLSLKRSDERY
ncbi:peptidase [Alteromonadaceae bacterium M269]|nr:peptidase [Alteromonadaceae bacterium M269]